MCLAGALWLWSLFTICKRWANSKLFTLLVFVYIEFVCECWCSYWNGYIWIAVQIYIRQQHSLKWPQLKISMSLKKNVEFVPTYKQFFLFVSVYAQVEMRLCQRMFITHITSFSMFRVDFYLKKYSYTLSHPDTVCIDHNLDYRIVFNAFISLVCYAAYNRIGGGDHWHHALKLAKSIRFNLFFSASLLLYLHRFYLILLFILAILFQIASILSNNCIFEILLLKNSLPNKITKHNTQFNTKDPLKYANLYQI